MQIRTPAVAGMFYPKEKDGLKTVIQDCFLHPFGPGKVPPATKDEDILGVICPHAGDRKSTRLNSSHIQKSRMPSSA